MAARLTFHFPRRLAASDGAFWLRPRAEAVVRCEWAAGRRLPPAFECAGEPPVAGDVLTPFLNDDDGSADGGAAGER